MTCRCECERRRRIQLDTPRRSPREGISHAIDRFRRNDLSDSHLRRRSPGRRSGDVPQKLPDPDDFAVRLGW